MNPIQPNKMAIRPILPLLLSMGLPAMLSMFIQSMYNIVDSMFIAQYSSEALTAVSLAFPVQNLILAFAVGTGIGINAVVSRRLGEKNQDAANSAVTHGLLLAIITSFAFLLIGSFLIEPFFNFFTDSPVIFELGVNYTTIITCFAFGTIIHIVIEKILQATGKMVFPMIFLATGAIINIILDPILIFGLLGFPQLGIEGAAIATIIGQLSAMTLAILTLVFVKGDVHCKIEGFTFNWHVIKDIYAIGVPATLIYSLGSILVMGLNTILIGFSEAAVSLFGIFFKLQSFIFMPILGLTQGQLPIIGYNYGAENPQRIDETMKWSLIITGAIALVGTVLFTFGSATLLSFFQATPEIYELGAVALPLLSLSFFPASIALIFSTLFQSIKRGGFSLGIALLRQGIIILPLSILVAPTLGLTGIWLTFILAETIAALTSIGLFYYHRKRDLIFNRESEIDFTTQTA
ncbi:MAG: MATE family efflux transporter [Culicoidibacterales bacterium]